MKLLHSSCIFLDKLLPSTVMYRIVIKNAFLNAYFSNDHQKRKRIWFNLTGAVHIEHNQTSTDKWYVSVQRGQAV